MVLFIAIILGFVMLIAALLAIQLESMVAAIVSAGVVSLFASVLFLLLSAPDVAMTEAAIGSGLTTVIFLYALKKIKTQPQEKSSSREE
jgi:uncharacterized MnhB-related membrane protein